MPSLKTLMSRTFSAIITFYSIATSIGLMPFASHDILHKGSITLLDSAKRPTSGSSSVTISLISNLGHASFANFEVTAWSGFRDQPPCRPLRSLNRDWSLNQDFLKLESEDHMDHISNY